MVSGLNHASLIINSLEMSMAELIEASRELKTCWVNNDKAVLLEGQAMEYTCTTIANRYSLDDGSGGYVGFFGDFIVKIQFEHDGKVNVSLHPIPDSSFKIPVG